MPKRRKNKKPRPEQRNITAIPRTANQGKYIEEIRKSSITICIGLPGTGKTFLAVSEAVKAIKAQEVKKIIISRPVVEAGETLGYLPGRIEDKTRPYLIPILDSMKEFLSHQEIAQLQNQGRLEICPLAYMRGRTFKNSFIILDEAQNATLSQMKMILTRLGESSKIVICGDTKQSDIQTDDLTTCARALRNIKGISVVELTRSDIVRHSLTGIIIERIEDAEQSRFGRNGSNGNGKNRIKQTA